MNISILCSDPLHPVTKVLEEWQQKQISQGHRVSLHHRKSELGNGDILFLVSCSELISERERENFSAVLVLHASDLPQGRGWSPHIWSVLEGKNQITLCLLEASDPVDSGNIWLKTAFTLVGNELLAEINEKLFAAETNLMDRAVQEFQTISPKKQLETEPTYYPKRTPSDSRLDPNQSLAEQFNLLRVVDNERYPAYFELHGQRYLIKIEKCNNESNTADD